MGLFSKKVIDIYSPADGILIDLEKVPDDAISSGMLGTGFAVEPEQNTIVSPVDGEITFIFPTKHALGLKTKQGIEVLIHLGIDTVELNGEGFTILKNEGSVVKVGDPLMSLDLEKIRKSKSAMCILLLPQKYQFNPLLKSNTFVHGGTDKIAQIQK